MALPVISNISSLNAQRNLQGSTLQLSKSLERLSSGLRINRAGDDAAGLAISEGLRSQIRGLDQAVRNSNDGLSLIGTAESAINAYTEMLQRMRELAVQSANDTNSASNRAALDLEAQQLLEEMQRIATTVEFNGTKLLDGTFTAKQLQVGAQAAQTIQINTGNLQTSAIGQVAKQLGSAVSLAGVVADGDITINGIDITNVPSYQDNVSTVDADKSAIAIADAINAKTSEHNVRAEAKEAVFSAGQTIAGGSITAASQNLTINGVDIFDSNITISANDSDGKLREAINAKSNQTGVVASLDGSNQLVLTADDGRNIQVSTTAGQNIGNVVGLTAGAADFSGKQGGTIEIISDDDIIMGGTAATKGGFSATTYFKDPNLAINHLQLGDVDGANLAITMVDNALNQINNMRAGLGAITNRLEYTISNLQSISENLSASDSRIRDADFAVETAKLSKNQIMQQAGIAVLAQANTTTQSALKLLQG